MVVLENNLQGKGLREFSEMGGSALGLHFSKRKKEKGSLRFFLKVFLHIKTNFRLTSNPFFIARASLCAEVLEYSKCVIMAIEK